MLTSIVIVFNNTKLNRLTLALLYDIGSYLLLLCEHYIALEFSKLFKNCTNRGAASLSVFTVPRALPRRFRSNTYTPIYSATGHFDLLQDCLGSTAIHVHQEELVFRETIAIPQNAIFHPVLQGNFRERFREFDALVGFPAKESGHFRGEVLQRQKVSHGGNNS